MRQEVDFLQIGAEGVEQPCHLIEFGYTIRYVPVQKDVV